MIKAILYIAVVTVLTAGVVLGFAFYYGVRTAF